MSEQIQLKGITWNHSRGYTSMAATAQRYEELNPNVRITWEKRSLQAFADEPIDQLAQRYDLLVIDHPWAGFAARSKVIVPLDKYLPAEFMADLAENNVGHSHESYSSEGHQWALAIDAATPVASSRPDLLKKKGFDLPKSWDDLQELADAGLVAVPGIPQDTLMNFYMVCSTLGEDPCQTEEHVVSEEMGVKALKILRKLMRNVNPECYDWNPIDVYEAMTRRDEFAYCPFAYGYANYTNPVYARRQLLFHDMVSFPGTEPLRSTLGGTGLAISASSKNIEVAADYAKYVGSPETQKGLFFEYGGQPGHRAAWTDAGVNEKSFNFFADTLPALDRAFLRPRYHGHMFFQDNAGAPIREYLMNGGDELELLQSLNELYRKSLKEK